MRYHCDFGLGVKRSRVARPKRRFGNEHTLDVIWWACRCHDMTRVADAFQLPLEREIVFGGPPRPASKTGTRLVFA